MAAERINISAAPTPLLDSIIDAEAEVNACEAMEREASKKCQEAMDAYVRLVLQAIVLFGCAETAGRVEKTLAGVMAGGGR